MAQHKVKIKAFRRADGTKVKAHVRTVHTKGRANSRRRVSGARHKPLHEAFRDTYRAMRKPHKRRFKHGGHKR